jgi:hypothetical protein
MPRKKRPRGGQPGNQNARKHGFYSVNMSPEEIEKFRQAVNQNNQDPALTALRQKVENAIINAPGNYRVLREGASLVVKYLNAKNDFGPVGNAFVKRTFRNILKASLLGDLNLTNQIVSASLKELENLQIE